MNAPNPLKPNFLEDLPSKAIPLPSEIKAMIRVNQAGEYGATRIYAGQLAILKNTPSAQALHEMNEQEQQHLKVFNQLSVEHSVTPTLFQPLWHVGGYLMGAATALLGEKAAHACTIAVEEVIADHYQGQLTHLENTPLTSETEHLKEVIARFRAEEMAHREEAIAQGGKEAFGYDLLSQVVKTISRGAIWLSTRL